MDSILGSIRKLIGGIAETESPFDEDLIIHINSVFTIIHQLGVGPKEPFAIVDDSETWSDFFEDRQTINLVKSYLYLKTKLIFDPPTTGVLHEAMERQVSEFEWRLKVAGDETRGKEENNAQPSEPEDEEL